MAVAVVDPEVSAQVQELYKDSLKKAKSCLKKGDVDGSVQLMIEFFEHTDLLAEYFHHRSVEEVSEEMLDRLEQAQSALASVFAEYPDRAKLFLTRLREIVDIEFDAFKAMKEQQA
ncbi:hypothetical protein GNI_138880 [Gregarina niphandrodes]|uniref:Uncharacterized protein n=1 Tax=Gregarina niphandrodes TaxID=110365 RepID=A0A023B180_GRENI|nr:hypothetical protein GNI_138880 [Gregarina niphandrodes]EZG45374.1 hypothetical protein GNI_138880 [Gregarina niphandrodes]|eukprot:XP_011132511.1 hypothetical protein GNI_138880 [Gregarina niphandrodes]